MDKFISIEADMSNYSFDILNLYEQIAKEDKRRAMHIMGRIVDLFNDKLVVEAKKIDLQKDYDMGIISKTEFEKMVSWL